MSLVSEIITDIRDEINDESSTRFTTDAPILRYIKRAILRANRIAQREGLQFAKKKATLTTVASQAYVSLPSDFDVDIALFRPADYSVLYKCSEVEWNSIVSASVLTCWYLDLENSKILFNGTPDAVESLYLYYFPKIDTSLYTSLTTMPWDGKLDDIIIEYVSLRLKNKDEMDVSTDLKLLTDFENQILKAYRPTSIMSTEGVGWI